jgi:hypothetical protein
MPPFEKLTTKAKNALQRSHELAMERGAEGCRKGIFFRDSVEKPAFKVRHLDGNLNQPYADFSPMMKDDALYFTSLKSNQTKEVNKKEVYSTYSRIYKSQKNGNEFTPGVNRRLLHHAALAIVSALTMTASNHSPESSAPVQRTRTFIP